MNKGIVIDRDVTCEGSTHAIRVANADVELALSTDFGPRVLHYAPRGGENVFGFVSPREQAKPTSFGGPWHIYGGHRLWHAPEDPVLSYVPDNDPVEVRIDGATLIVARSVEPGTSLVKELKVTLDGAGSRVVVEHRIGNAGNRTVRLAPWALSVMARGGVAIVPNAPFVPFPDALLPSSRLVLWPYTALGDPRFTFGRRYMRIAQDPLAAAAQKIGVFEPHHGWVAYAVGARVFVKRYAPPTTDSKLVDFGCNVEVFTNGAFLELETLGEEKVLGPGESAIHAEHWYLFDDVVLPAGDEEAHRVLEPLLARTVGLTAT